MNIPQETNYRLGAIKCTERYGVKKASVKYHTSPTHNHYGDNDESRFSDESDRIENSSKHKNDNFYTGPGH